MADSEGSREPYTGPRVPHDGSIIDVGWRCRDCGYEFGFEVCVRPDCNRGDYHLRGGVRPATRERIAFLRSAMACLDCAKAQQEFFFDHEPNETYARIGEGNVLVCGCKDHVTELLVRVRTKTEKMDDRDHRIMLTGFLHGISESVKQIAKNMDISSPDLNRITESIDRIVKASLEQLPEVTHEMKTTFLRNF